MVTGGATGGSLSSRLLLQTQTTVNATASSLSQPSHTNHKLEEDTTSVVTICLLIIIHLLFVWQCNQRSSRRSILVCYRTLVEFKHFYKAPLALLSHPPTKRSSSSREHSAHGRSRSPAASLLPNDNSMFSASATAGLQTGGRLSQFLTRNGPQFSLFSKGQPLSGLPLLFYNVHILWSCRALEAHVGGGWAYLRLLVNATTLVVCADLCLTYGILQILETHQYGSSEPITIHDADSISSRRSPRRRHVNSTLMLVQQHHERILTGRPLGSLTSTTAFLLLFYRFAFPHVPLQIVPLLPPVLFLREPTLSYAFCVNLLLMLSFDAHPISGVLCGSAVGYLWGSGLLSFLGQIYWGTGFLVTVMLAMGMSLRASDSFSSWVPCIEYVAWDSSGRWKRISSSQHGTIGDDDEDSEENEEEMALFDESSHNNSHSDSIEDSNGRDDEELGFFSSDELPRRRSSLSSFDDEIPGLLEPHSSNREDLESSSQEDRVPLLSSTGMRPRRGASSGLLP